jgi:hypothetical protein
MSVMFSSSEVRDAARRSSSGPVKHLGSGCRRRPARAEAFAERVVDEAQRCRGVAELGRRERRDGERRHPTGQRVGHARCSQDAGRTGEAKFDPLDHNSRPARATLERPDCTLVTSIAALIAGYTVTIAGTGGIVVNALP